MDKARSMLSGVGLTQEFQVEGIETEKYMVNMSPSLMLVDSTPHEVWSSKNSFLSHLKVFGCDAFLNVARKRGETWTRRKSSIFSLDTKKK
jgi:hypothetical protein